ncbi:MAG: methionyl aminopeptidase [Chlamydiia bacterium]|nr:methionyl aminopeptidase [Chlamydiia bacterium]
MTSRNDPCWCGSGKKWKKCHFPTPPAEDIRGKYQKQYGILVKTPDEIKGIRRACQTAKNILNELCKAAKEGVTTLELDELAQKLHKKAGARAAPLHYGYPPFPKSICTSINEVICHGIPENRPLKNGDIINIDVTAIVDGFYGDLSRMVMIGEVSEDKKLVVEVSKECLDRAIKILKPGLPLKAIGDAITDYAESMGCSVVHQFVGHGVGVDFHEPPQVPHHRNQLNIPLAAGMTFTIEPMINAGSPNGIIDPSDKWTARTEDGKPSAQWEHTLLITDTGVEVLTG